MSVLTTYNLTNVSADPHTRYRTVSDNWRLACSGDRSRRQERRAQCSEDTPDRSAGDGRQFGRRGTDDSPDGPSFSASKAAAPNRVVVETVSTTELHVTLSRPTWHDVGISLNSDAASTAAVVRRPLHRDGAGPASVLIVALVVGPSRLELSTPIISEVRCLVGQPRSPRCGTEWESRNAGRSIRGSPRLSICRYDNVGPAAQNWPGRRLPPVPRSDNKLMSVMSGRFHAPRARSLGRSATISPSISERNVPYEWSIRQPPALSATSRRPIDRTDARNRATRSVRVSRATSPPAYHARSDGVCHLWGGGLDRHPWR